MAYRDDEDYDWDEEEHPYYDEETYYVLLTENNFQKEEISMDESIKTAILDTACTKTVCGFHWFCELVYLSFIILFVLILTGCN